MLHMRIFTDGSVNNKLRVGCGACLMVPDVDASIETLNGKVKIKRFENTSSTKLELQTLLWALEEITSLTEQNNINCTIYTDSQNIVSLPGRRMSLEQNNYFSSKNKRLNNFKLYQQFYRLTSGLKCEFVKVAGHQSSNIKDQIDTLFSLVDKASRRALRKTL